MHISAAHRVPARRAFSNAHPIPAYSPHVPSRRAHPAQSVYPRRTLPAVLTSTATLFALSRNRTHPPKPDTPQIPNESHTSAAPVFSPRILPRVRYPCPDRRPPECESGILTRKPLCVIIPKERTKAPLPGVRTIPMGYGVTATHETLTLALQVRVLLSQP